MSHQLYDPKNIVVTVGGVPVVAFSDIVTIKKPNIEITYMSDYGKDHPDYDPDLVRVKINKILRNDGNFVNASFKLKRDSEYLKEIIKLDPFDDVSITAKIVGEVA